MATYDREIRGEGLGDIFSDRAFGEFPLLFGRETEEAEARAARPWPADGMGDVFSDKVFGEYPLLWGYEVTEES